MQNHYNLLYREEEREMLGLCARRGDRRAPLEPARPRATGPAVGPEGEHGAGRTSDEFGKTLYAGTEEADRAVVDRLGEVAAARGVPRAQVALAWLLGKPAVTSPIIGATKPHHLEDAVAALSPSSPRRRWRGWRSPTCPIPYSGSREEIVAGGPS